MKFEAQWHLPPPHMKQMVGLDGGFIITVDDLSTSEHCWTLPDKPMTFNWRFSQDFTTESDEKEMSLHPTTDAAMQRADEVLEELTASAGSKPQVTITKEQLDLLDVGQRWKVRVHVEHTNCIGLSSTNEVHVNIKESTRRGMCGTGGKDCCVVS
eukprot:TRINITY_DN7515_c0_g1_i2.p2 TRINITY_DN7515_c0_g1~~TRINITY_DN7515_c0_g1_i2.p2  ORF type:complete len:155 (-),score=31.99 TRINITY_DN7515_c0_g1_i2:337-801(-)